MEEDERPAYASLVDALRSGAGVDAIMELMEGLREERMIEADAAGGTLLMLAVGREAEVFEVVLAASSKRAIGLGDVYGSDLMLSAIRAGCRAAVLLIGDRVQREREEDRSTRGVRQSEEEGRGQPGGGGDIEGGEGEGGLIEWRPFASDGDIYPYVTSLFAGPLITDKDVVDLVFGLASEADVCMHVTGEEPLVTALRSKYDSDYAIEMCISRGPSMKERLRSRRMYGPLYYVSIAAEHKDVAMVQRMHELVPLMSDGSGRRAHMKLYAQAIEAAACNETDSCAIMEYLVESGGIEALEKCRESLMWSLRTKEQLRYVISRAPNLFLHLAGESAHTGTVDWILSRPCQVTEYLVDVTMAMVAPEAIWRMLLLRRNILGRNWRVQVRRLFEEVPQTCEGQIWECLMQAIEERQYDDVDVLLAIVPRVDLALQYGSGRRASDVAAADRSFPKELLGRLAVVTKGAM